MRRKMEGVLGNENILGMIKEYDGRLAERGGRDYRRIEVGDMQGRTEIFDDASISELVGDTTVRHVDGLEYIYVDDASHLDLLFDGKGAIFIPSEPTRGFDRIDGEIERAFMYVLDGDETMNLSLSDVFAFLMRHHTRAFFEGGKQCRIKFTISSPSHKVTPGIEIVTDSLATYEMGVYETVHEATAPFKDAHEELKDVKAKLAQLLAKVYSDSIDVVGNPNNFAVCLNVVIEMYTVRNTIGVRKGFQRKRRSTKTKSNKKTKYATR